MFSSLFGRLKKSKSKDYLSQSNQLKTNNQDGDSHFLNEDENDHIMPSQGANKAAHNMIYNKKFSIKKKNQSSVALGVFQPNESEGNPHLSSDGIFSKVVELENGKAIDPDKSLSTHDENPIGSFATTSKKKKAILLLVTIAFIAIISVIAIVLSSTSESIPDFDISINQVKIFLLSGEDSTKCLSVTSTSTLARNPCDPSSGQQIWSIANQNRLLSGDGRCVSFGLHPVAEECIEEAQFQRIIVSEDYELRSEDDKAVLCFNEDDNNGFVDDEDNCASIFEQSEHTIGSPDGFFLMYTSSSKCISFSGNEGDELQLNEDDDCHVFVRIGDHVSSYTLALCLTRNDASITMERCDGSNEMQLFPKFNSFNRLLFKQNEGCLDVNNNIMQFDTSSACFEDIPENYMQQHSASKRFVSNDDQNLCLTNEFGTMSLLPCNYSTIQSFVVNNGRVVVNGYCLNSNGAFAVCGTKNPELESIYFFNGYFMDVNSNCVSCILSNSFSIDDANDCAIGDGCCSIENRCGVDQGHCKSDDECFPGLECVIGGCSSDPEKDCCQPVSSECFASNVIELLEQIDDCPYYRINLLGAIIFLDQPLDIISSNTIILVHNGTINVQGSNNRRRNRVLQQTENEEVAISLREGSLSLEDMNVNGSIVVQGNGTNLDLINTSINSTQSTIILQDGASLFASGCYFHAQSNYSIYGCDMCRISLLHSTFYVTDLDFPTLVNDAFSLFTSGIKIITNPPNLDVSLIASNRTESKLPDTNISIPQLQLAEAKMVFDPYENCTSFESLMIVSQQIDFAMCRLACESFDNEACRGFRHYYVGSNDVNMTTLCEQIGEPDLEKCPLACETFDNEACHQIIDNFISLVGVCELLGEVDTHSCQVVDLNLETPGLGSNSTFYVAQKDEELMPTQAFELVSPSYCLVQPSIMLTNATTLRNCKAMAGYHDLNAIHFENGQCQASTTVKPCGMTSNNIHVKAESANYMVVGESCKPAPSTLIISELINITITCDVLCEQTPECLATQIDWNSKICRLLRDAEGVECFILNDENAKYSLMVAPDGPIAHFPKKIEFTRFSTELDPPDITSVHYIIDGNIVYSTVLFSIDPLECEVLCMRNVHCQAYQFDVQSLICDLKDRPDLTVSSTDSTSLRMGFMKVESSFVDYLSDETIEKKNATENNTIGLLGNSTIDACQVSCALQSSCVSVGFDYTTSICRFHNEVVESHLDQYIDLFLIHVGPYEAIGDTLVIPDQNVQFYSFRNQIYVSSKSDCASFCNNTRYCTGFAEISPTICELKFFHNFAGVLDTPIVYNDPQPSFTLKPLEPDRSYVKLTSQCLPEDRFPFDSEALSDTTLPLCKTLCEMTYDCQSITFEVGNANSTNGRGKCSLFRKPVESCTNKTQADNTTSVYIAQSAFSFSDNFPNELCASGEELEISYVVSLEYCKRRCIEYEDKCGSIRYLQNLNGRCYLHRGSSTRRCTRSNPTQNQLYISTSTTVEEQYSFLEMPNSISLVEPYILSMNLTAARCRRRCELDESNCLAYAIVNETYCSFYNATDFKEQEQDDLSLYVRFEPDRYTALADRCIVDESNSILVEELENVNLCGAYCDSFEECQSFTYNETSQQCMLHDNQYTMSCANETLYIPHSYFEYAQDDSSCGDVDPETRQLSRSECKKLCDIKGDLCYAFTHNPRTLECSIMESLGDNSCPQLSGDSCPSCGTRSLYVSYKRYANFDASFDFVDGNVCQGLNTWKPTGNITTLFGCQNACLNDENCFTILFDNVTCTLGGNNDFFHATNCSEVQTKLYLD